MNTVEALQIAERRLSVLNLDYPGSSEEARFRDVIVPDLQGKLTADERKEYEALKAGKSAEQIKKEHEAELRQMEANKDKPSH